MDCHRIGDQHSDAGLVADLPAVAVRAMKTAVSPLFAHPGDRGQLVDQPGRDEQGPAPDRTGSAQIECESGVITRDADDLVIDDLPAVSADLLTSPRQQPVGADAFVAKQPVDRFCRCVAGLSRIDECHRPTCADQGQCGAQSCRSCSNDDDVSERVGVFCHDLVLPIVPGPPLWRPDVPIMTRPERYCNWIFRMANSGSWMIR